MPFPTEVISILRRLEGIPYENLTKIVAFSRNPSPSEALDTPEKLYRKSVETGAGGTCFSLTYFLYDQLGQAGFETRFVMGDKYRTRNIHCGLLFPWDGEEYLLDPGYMIYDPLRLPRAGLRLFYPLIPNAVCVEDRMADNVWRLYTGHENNLKMRFDFRKSCVTEEEFIRFWEATFYFGMMEYPVLNMTQGGIQYYLQKRTLMTRTSEGSTVKELTRLQFEKTASGQFGISADVVSSFMEIMMTKRKDLFLPDTCIS